MKLGAEDKKKVWALGVLLVVAAYFVYSNVLSSPSSSYTPPRSAAGPRNPDPESMGAAPTGTAPNATAATGAPAQSTQPRPLIVNRNSRSDEFHPVLRPRGRQGEVQIDPTTVDPTIHIELLAKVQDAKIEGGRRNLFQFGAAAPAELPKGEEKIIKVAKVFDYPRPLPPPPPPPGPVQPPPPTPPSFKYYGLATKKIDNKRTAFFLDGEDIILATEGMTVKSRWKVMRIGSDSVMLEDAQNKRQQALAISEEAGGGQTN
jgi:hypothetical protein